MKNFIKRLLRQGASAESQKDSGSMSERAESLRQHLPGILEKLHVKTLLDAPCGDFAWMSHVPMPENVSYIGADHDELLILSLEVLYGNDKRSFGVLDITCDVLPQADLWLCRRVLPYLSQEDVFGVLKNFAMSPIRYILTDSVSSVDNQNVKTSGVHHVNLERPPFNLPEPVLQIPDFNATEVPNFLNLWSREQVLTVLRRGEYPKDVLSRGLTISHGPRLQAQRGETAQDSKAPRDMKNRKLDS